MQPHAKLAKMTLKAIQTENPDCRVFQRQAGPVVVGGFHMAGITPGLADLWGFVKREPFAIPFEIEIKTGSDRMKPEQLAWMKTCKSLNVPHLVVRADNQEHFSGAADSAAAWVKGLIP